ncbi:MAG TPA: glutathione-disulfide reductase [Kofleriaceae bacterium]|jgi:glutathione reductase (NADPH)|nr:glutathione-disulfide reductase [Kofleriaceae bacterium]
MARFDVDLFVIGGGSGGVRAARVAAEHGARVAVAEADRWGGTCVIRGCVPKKLLVYASEISRTLSDARGQGWTIPEARHDWAALIAAKDKEITRLSSAYADRLRKAGAEVLTGRARLTDRHTVEVAGRTITAANILVATGGRARRPSNEWITSDEAFHLAALPDRIAIMGGGYIAIEFAHIFAGLGAKVTLIHRDPLVLRGFDPDIRKAVTDNLTAHGIDFLCCTELLRRGNRVIAGGREVEVDVAMAAIGRDPATAELGLAEAGVQLDARGAITVDEWSRTSVEHIYAVGDVTGRVALTPVAIREGHAVADTLFGHRPTPIHHHLIPTAVFAQPAAAAIGLTEPAAQAAGHDAVVFRARFRPMRYALSGRDEQVLIKVIVDRATDRVLGVHMVGIEAPEIIQTIAIAVTMGATKADLDRTFALHPTTAEELVLLR